MMSVINPRQTVLVTCREETDTFGKISEKDNIITLDWHTPLSFEPQMYAIAVGKTRFSLKLIRESKCFAVNFMPYTLKEEIVFCGRNSGMHVDKFDRTGLTKIECEKIDCPAIKEALARIECEIVQEIDTGDHVLFIGKAVFSKKYSEGKRPFHVIKDEFTTTVR